MKHSIKTFFFVLTLLFLAQVSSAKIRLPAIIADSMVLQQHSDAPLWGWASPGEKIVVNGSWKMGSGVSTTAGADGKWMVKIQTPAAGGPYTITLRGTVTIVLKGILIGEVWLCSGQSNMEMPVQGWMNAPITHSKETLATAGDYPGIRLFTVKQKVSYTPEEDVVGSWASSSPQSVAAFSATAYFFGRELARRLKVPVGLIHSSWGGTVAEAWTSGKALTTLGDFNSALVRVDSIQRNIAALIKEDRENELTWKAMQAKTGEPYPGSGFNDDDWKTMRLPTLWENAGYPDLDGIVWFRKVVTVPDGWVGRKLKLHLGPIDDDDITYFNGTKIGSTAGDGAWFVPRNYEIPGELVKAGGNVIAIRVADNAGGGGIYGDPSLLRLSHVVNPSSERSDSIPEESISLAGDWKFLIAAEKPRPAIVNNPNVPTVLYNGMIAPLIPFSIRGALWYQGEANVGRAAQYERLFPLMIADWRSRWKKGNFPFYFVQIAPFHYGGDSIQAAALRDAQRKTLSTVNTGMVVTSDIGEYGNIHPANKEEVGRRLSLWALANTYGEKGILFSGPLYKDMQVQGQKVVVSFTYGEGLHTRGKVPGDKAGGTGEVKGFEIAGADGRWVPAVATLQGDQVIVQGKGVSSPVAVRYNWSATSEASLFNKEGLPASSFSTK